ncbi:MAG TPA: choice-of-anchor V domain-containing protein [Longimicrobium sp.]|jgi:hypothetical protein
MKLWRVSAALAVAAIGFAGIAIPVRGARGAFPDGPPPGFTGGFGEPTCAQCHMGEALNEAGGTLSLAGIPDAYRPGEPYRITVSLARGDLQRGGFELSARFADGAAAGRQAGSFRAPDERVKVVEGTPSGVQYAGHARPGVQPAAPGRIEWTVEWTAPASAAGSVVFHAAANSANGDESQFGDLVYTLEKVVKAGP